MSVPQTSSSEATYAMSDFNMAKKEMDVTIRSVEEGAQRPVMGRRKTTNEVRAGATSPTLELEQEEDGLTKFGNFLWKIHKASILTRYSLYILPVAIVLAVPIILLKTVYKGESGNGPKHQGIHLLGLFIWLEEIWVIFWLAKIVAHYVPVCSVLLQHPWPI